MDKYDIKKALERAVDYLAEASAAQTYSTPSDSDPEDVIITAEFGDWIAINGDLVFEKGKPGHPGGWGDVPNDQKIPKDYIKTNQGGAIPVVEEEVSLDHVIDAAALALGVPRGKSLSRAKIEAVAREMFDGRRDVTYTSVSGKAAHYIKRAKEQNPKNIDEFTRAYIEAALWISTDESTPSGGEPMDKNYSAADIAPGTLKKMIADCKKFQKENAEDLATWPGGRYSAEEIGGHDFWLTRNGHGSGFWDGDWPEEAGERLTSAAKKFHEFNLYVGDDKLIHGDRE